MKSFLHTQWAAPGANLNCDSVQTFWKIHLRAACLHTLVRRGFFGEENVQSFVLFVGGEDLLFAVAASGVDFPGGEFGATKDGFVVLGAVGSKLVISG
jgi:hypothetical protein